MLGSPLWSRLLINLPGMELRGIIFSGWKRRPHMTQMMAARRAGTLLSFLEHLCCKVKLYISPHKAASTRAVSTDIIDSLTMRENMSDVHEAQGAMGDWILFSRCLFLQPVTFTLCLLCLKSNWNSKKKKDRKRKRKGRDWIADWIASQGHLSVEEMHNNRRSRRSAARFTLSSQKQLHKIMNGLFIDNGCFIDHGLFKTQPAYEPYTLWSMIRLLDNLWQKRGFSPNRASRVGKQQLNMVDQRKTISQLLPRGNHQLGVAHVFLNHRDTRRKN